MRVVVTGASGAVGRRLCEDLELAGHEVTRLGRRADEALRVLGTTYDVDDLRAHLGGVDAVAHLAWRRTPSPRLSDFYPSLTATENLLDACSAEGVARLVGASSISVYSGEPSWSEQTVPRPTTAYGLSKLAGESLLSLAASSSLSTMSLRLGHVFTHDEVNQYAVNVFIDRASAGQPIVVTGDSARRRDMVYAADVSRAFQFALTNRSGPSVLNIGSGSPVSMGDLAEAAAAAFGGRSTVTRDDTFGDGTGSTSMDISAAAESLGYRPEHDITTAMADIARRRSSRA